jgi:serine palmitoyltransferase
MVPEHLLLLLEYSGIYKHTFMHLYIYIYAYICIYINKYIRYNEPDYLEQVLYIYIYVCIFIYTYIYIRHNEPDHLEQILREAISNGQPRHHRPWKKIVVMVEGIYSMEGSICNLKEIVRVCKKNKAYIYVDEAHSIGALGSTGRGVCEYCGVDPADIDILMGTFTKSFAGQGGYIAASKEIIEYIKSVSSGILHHNSLSPIVAQQVLTAFKVIMGEDNTTIGRRKINQLQENSNYFRAEMKKLGLHVYGDVDSPIVPVMVYFPAKLAAFSRECLKRGVAVVVVSNILFLIL